MRRMAGVRFPAGSMLGIFLFTTASRTALGLTQPPIQWVPGALSMGVKQPRREAHHSPPSSDVGQRKSGAIPPLPNTPSWRGAQLKHRDNFTFTFYFYIMQCVIAYAQKKRDKA
jgi:hypothetical protein